MSKGRIRIIAKAKIAKGATPFAESVKTAAVLADRERASRLRYMLYLRAFCRTRTGGAVTVEFDELRSDVVSDEEIATARAVALGVLHGAEEGWAAFSRVQLDHAIQ